MTDNNQLIIDYLPLAYRIARESCKMFPRADEHSIYSDAQFALLHAGYKFDPSKNVKFATYAIPKIRWAILDGMRKRDWVPRDARKNEAKIVHMNPSDDFGNISVDDFPGKRLAEEDEFQFLISDLTGMQRRCVVLHYKSDMTYREIGEACGVSKQSVAGFIWRAKRRVKKKVS